MFFQNVQNSKKITKKRKKEEKSIDFVNLLGL